MNGIIQEVFKKFLNEYIGSEELIENICKELQQELIEKIKQEVNAIVIFNEHIESSIGEKDFQHFLIKLIGDNQ